MKNRLTLFITCLSLLLTAQNNLHISGSIAQGNSSWRYGNIEINETNDTGKILNTYDIDIHANCPTILGAFNIGYQLNKLQLGIGFTVQHFF